MCIGYYQVDPYYSNMMYNPPDVRWRMLNHIMSQYYLHYLGIFKLKGLCQEAVTLVIKPCALIPDLVHMCCTLVPEMLCHPSHGTDCPLWGSLATPTEILSPV